MTPAPRFTSRRTLLAGLAVLSASPVLSASVAWANHDPSSRLGIILVGASWCPWCHGAADQLHVATLQWGWPVLIASLDNKPIPPFDAFIEASDHPLTVGINRLPTTLIVEPTSDHIVSGFEGYKGAVSYLSRIANTFEAWAEGQDAHG